MGPQVFLLAVLDHALRANSTLVDRVDLVTKAYRCPLHRLRVPRLLLPRSGLERSDFVRCALFGHGDMSDLSLLCAVKRTYELEPWPDSGHSR